MLLNARKLLQYIGDDRAAVAIQCPCCDEVFVRCDWWQTLQRTYLDIVCVCAYRFQIPKYDASLVAAGFGGHTDRPADFAIPMGDKWVPQDSEDELYTGFQAA